MQEKIQGSVESPKSWQGSSSDRKCPEWLGSGDSGDHGFNDGRQTQGWNGLRKFVTGGEKEVRM